jgi:DNA-directed RNA polymerase subunit RPC12/RpoP
MPTYLCTKCNTFVDKKQMAAHVKKCGNKRFAVFKRRGER